MSAPAADHLEAQRQNMARRPFPKLPMVIGIADWEAFHAWPTAADLRRLAGAIRGDGERIMVDETELFDALEQLLGA